MEPTKSRIVQEAVATSKDVKNRKLLTTLVALTALLFASVMVGGFFLYQSVRTSAEDGQDLASQVQAECDSPGGELDSSSELCNKSQSVINDAPAAVAKGDPGPAGPAGSAGAQGAQGPAGEDGEDGEDGARGARGPRGFIGPVGPTGATGATGATGETGAQGEPGANGENGAAGPAGPEGPQGPTGATGDRGATGPMGPPGVASVETDCTVPEGQVIDEIMTDYIADTQTIRVTCTYKDDETLINPAPGGDT